MKNTFLFSILLLFMATTLTAKSVPFYAKISNPTDRFLMFSYTKQGRTDASMFRIDLNSDDEIQFELQLEEAKFADLVYGGKTIPLYVELEDQLKIYFDAADVQTSLRFEGQGAENNNFLAKYKRQFRSPDQFEYDIAYLKMNVDAPIQLKANALDAEDYGQYILGNQRAQEAFLESHKPKLSATLYDYMKTEIVYTNEANRMIWFVENYYKLEEEAAIKRHAAEMGALTQQIHLHEEHLYSHPAFINFMRTYAIYNFLPFDLQRYKLHLTLYETINKKITGRAKYYLQTDLLLRVYERSMNGDLARKHFGEFSKSNPYPEYTEALMNFYGGEIGGTEETAAPNFEMKTLEGDIISLADYQGKVIYISYWASWCKPCIAGFEKSAVTRQKMQDMGIVLLNVSIDKSEQAWKTAMNKHNPLGVNGLVLSLEDISKKYNISSIPQYYIIDKNGKFTYLPTDGQRNILEEFRVLVEN